LPAAKDHTAMWLLYPDLWHSVHLGTLRLLCSIKCNSAYQGP